jgi:SPP1 gp7 family putative phage head morphogenesis protein
MFARRVKMTNPFSSLTKSGLMDGWLQSNVDLITSIDTRFFADVRETVEAGVRSGTNTKKLAEEIKDRFGVSDSRARLIARDQVAKLNSNITQNRQASLGVKQYIWSTSKDGRVRESHQEMDGVLCDYASPPIVDGEAVNPGEQFQCRCVAIAVLPGETAEELRQEYGFAA